jgi:site-specific DNA-methyltransferase (adenine-specific)
MELNKVYHGKMEKVLPVFPEDMIDSIIGDPPYGLSFMGKKWDYDVPSVDQWKEAYRVLKPGGYMLIACGTRTQHRMVVNIEDAGFEIRDVITWHYGSGFPKSLDISKAIDKLAGVERDIVGTGTSNYKNDEGKIEFAITKATSDEAKEWEGWGTALKPATEFWTLCRKPLSEPTVAENVLKHGAGGINIDACRIEFVNEEDKKSAVWGRGTDILGGNYVGATHTSGKENIEPNAQGRFPANLILDEFMAAELDKQSGVLTSGHMDTISQGKNYGIYGKYNGKKVYAEGDTGGASRFFYIAKPSQYERNKGLKGRRARFMDESRKEGSASGTNPRNRGAETQRENFHPTVKPIELMRYLVKLITPKGGIVLDPFCGSGSTLIACKLELVNYVGIEMEEEYVAISEARVKAWNPEKYKPQQLF